MNFEQAMSLLNHLRASAHTADLSRGLRRLHQYVIDTEQARRLNIDAVKAEHAAQERELIAYEKTLILIAVMVNPALVDGDWSMQDVVQALPKAVKEKLSQQGCERSSELDEPIPYRLTDKAQTDPQCSDCGADLNMSDVHVSEANPSLGEPSPLIAQCDRCGVSLVASDWRKKLGACPFCGSNSVPWPTAVVETFPFCDASSGDGGAR